MSLGRSHEKGSLITPSCVCCSCSVSSDKRTCSWASVSNSQEENQVRSVFALFLSCALVFPHNQPVGTLQNILDWHKSGCVFIFT